MVVRLYELFSLFCLVERVVEVKLNILGAPDALITHGCSLNTYSRSYENKKLFFII